MRGRIMGGIMGATALAGCTTTQTQQEVGYYVPVHYEGTAKVLTPFESRNDDFVWPTQIMQKRNGIACPKCGEEMFDDLTRVLTSWPEQTPIFCEGCGFHDTRY